MGVTVSGKACWLINMDVFNTGLALSSSQWPPKVLQQVLVFQYTCLVSDFSDLKGLPSWRPEARLQLRTNATAPPTWQQVAAQVVCPSIILLCCTGASIDSSRSPPPPPSTLHFIVTLTLLTNIQPPSTPPPPHQPAPTGPPYAW